MVQTKLIASLAVLLLAVSCQTQYSWQKFKMDGHRTGVTAADAETVEKAMGKVDGNVYYAPNGKVFAGGATLATAKCMIQAQPLMKNVREVIARCPQGMLNYSPESPLSNWTVDRMMEFTRELTGRRVDVGIFNFGGIRVDMPVGNVTTDDIKSMFPFKNHICYVVLKGADLRKIFEQFARNEHPECVGGVKFVIRNRSIDKLLVGGEPLDDNALYGVSTTDFLLDGGDGLSVAKNAVELVICEEIVMDKMLPYVRSCGKAGKPLQASTDGRVEIIK